MLYVEPDENDAHFYRNAQADELVYVAQGHGHARDRCSATCRTARATTSSSTAASCTAGGSTSRPSRPSCWSWRAAGTCAGPSATGTNSASCIEGAPYSERDIRRPSELRTHDERGDFPILVKQYDGLNEIILDHHPFDVVGWDGYFYPWAFNINDFEPIVGRVHQPPPVHQTFQGDGFVVCSFCPRPYDFHPEGGARRRTTTATWTRTRCCTTPRASS